MKTFESKYPSIPGSSINKEKSISESQTSQAIPEDYIDMYFGKTLLGSRQGCTAFAFRYCSKLAKRWGRISIVDELGIFGGCAEELVVTKALVSE
jgi:hypothetical protein